MGVGGWRGERERCGGVGGEERGGGPVYGLLGSFSGDVHFLA